MIALHDVEEQLVRVGMKNRFFGRPEVKELCHILAPKERIMHAVNGQYEGGFAMFIATDRRILLIDKKPWFLTMEDIRYDMIQEVDYNARLLDATIAIITFSKQLRFTSWRQGRLREMLKYIQYRVMDLRQVENIWHNTQSNYGQNTQIASKDFAHSYKTHVKRHSMAHVAGKVAMGVERTRPIIRPLYPRPSLVSKYQQASFAQPQSVAADSTN